MIYSQKVYRIILIGLSVLFFGRISFAQFSLYPNIKNQSDHIVEIAPQPIFSIPGGFYSGSQSVRFIHADDVHIYFTLDGRPPDDTSTLYETPIILNETKAIRAVAYQDSKAPSDIFTNTYFIDIPVNLPVMSLVTDPDNFFDKEIGIYVTGVNGTGGYCAGVISNVNQDWERPINIELYEMNGAQVLNQRAGVKIFGGCSRHRYPQKSLALYARKQYGKGSFRCRLFKEKDIDKFEAFILRSSADDQVFTMFRDAAAQQLLAKNMDADYQAYRPAVVYLNGDYWGIHNIREKINEHYVAGNFDLETDNINLLERRGKVLHGSNADYYAMLDYVSNRDMSNPVYYAHVKTEMDIDQYIDYMVGHIYLAERDWPGNNIKFWKANTGEYSKWRWINYDLDQTLTTSWIRENMIQKCTTATGPGWPNPEWSTRLFRNLLQSREFRNEFLNRYAWHMNTTFKAERVTGLIDSLADHIRPEIPNHIERWGGQLDETGHAAESWIRPTFDSIELWEKNVESMRIFARERQKHTIENMVDFFGLSGVSNLNVNVNIPDAGRLLIFENFIPDGFQGIFFRDIPLTLDVTPVFGYEFSHWEAQSADIVTYDTPDIEITLTGDMILTAHFRVGTSLQARFALTNEYNLDTNYPNPFKSSTMIRFSILHPGKVRLCIFNIQGQKIRTLINRDMNSGEHHITWDGKNETGKVVSSGVFIVTLKTTDKVLSCKITKIP